LTTPLTLRLCFNSHQSKYFTPALAA